MKNIESIQRRAATFVRGDCDHTSSVTSMSRDLGYHLCSLAARCTTRCYFTRSIVGQLSSVLPLSPPHLQTYSHRIKYQYQPTVDYFEYFIFVQTVLYWNSLSPKSVNANSLTSFFSQVSNMYCHLIVSAAFTSSVAPYNSVVLYTVNQSLHS